jgi:predicted nucleic acid-binding protein
VSYLLDTNVLSELRKGHRADPGVLEWFGGIDDRQLYLSVLVVGEIRRGIELIRRRDDASASVLDGWLRQVVTQHDTRILPIDRAIAETWALFNVPDPVPVVDGLLAATAHVHGLTLVTRNSADIARTGVPHLNPFGT